MRLAPLQTLEARIKVVDREIALRRTEKQRFGGFGKVLAGTSIVQAQLDGLRLEAEINILEQERSYLRELKSRILEMQSEEARRLELERLRIVHQNVHAGLQKTRGELEDLLRRHPVKSRIFIGSPEYLKRQDVQARVQRQTADNERAYQDHQRQLRLLQDTRPSAPLEAFELRRSEVNAIL